MIIVTRSLSKRPAKAGVFKFLRFNKERFQKAKGVSFQRNCGAASVGVLQDNLVLSTELIM